MKIKKLKIIWKNNSNGQIIKLSNLNLCILLKSIKPTLAENAKGI